LVVYFRQSGSEKQRVEINSEIVKIVSISSSEYAIFSQFFNRSRISIYYENLNQINTDLEIQNSIIYDAILLDNYLIFSSSNGLYKYDFNLNTLNSITSNLKASKLIPSEMGSFVYLTVGTELWTYSGNGNLTLLSSYGDSIRNFIPVYNK
jgi:hypothetical protein